MNAYGDPQSARARARVPGPSAASTPDDEPAGRPSGSASVGGPAGRASVGGASAGRASVGSASVGSASVGSASVGSASVGSASVGGRASVGSASVGSASVGAAPVGSASVGPARAAASVPPAGGRAPVARAAVRPPSAAGPGGPGGPAGPGGPGGPGGSGGSGRGGRSKADKKHRRANILTAAAAVLVIMLGVGIVGGTYFFDDVELPTPQAEAQMNVITDVKGNVLAKKGSPRINVPYQNISEVVQHAVAAAEDKNFYKHNGIDMKGIARAAWNNFTDGDRQGASTITQQYARHVADLKEISYSRKLREAVIARKLESKYDKPQIMGMYLNYVDLGEGRYGAEAAANGYFNASVIKGSKNEINVYQAAVLASIIKQPYPNSAHQGYDPNYNLTDAKDRWEYTLKNMLEMGWMTQEQYDKRKYPAVNKPNKGNSCKTCAAGKPSAMIMRHVDFELKQIGISEEELTKGGYTITTTINPKVQRAAEKAGSRLSKTSPMYKRPASYQAAVIGIDPDTGRVLGYYGGDDPNGTDYGSYMAGDGSGIVDYGGQSPGSTFKIYTLAAGLKEQISFDTLWDGSLKRPNGTPISNAGQDPGDVCGGKIKYCDLETSTIKSYNFPFYWIADSIGRDKVIEAARDAGIRYMWTDAKKGHLSGEMVDLTKTKPSTWKSSGYFDNEVAFGQYRVVPLEHAQGVATIVNGGVRHDAHFIKTVKKRDSNTGKQATVWSENLKGKQVFDAAQMSNLLGVMQEIPKSQDHRISDGRQSVAKSGTWEFKKGNGDTWYVGGIPQMAVTVWVGGAKDKVQLKEAGGGKMYGSGTPAEIWEEFIETVVDELNWEKEEFPQRIKTGNADSEYANGQEPPPPPPPADPNQNKVCEQFPILCQGGQNGGNAGGNPGGNAGPGGGNAGPGGGNAGPGGGNAGPGGGNNPGNNNRGNNGG